MTREQAQEKLFEHVKDAYQRHHALMVGTAMEGYGKIFGEDSEEWFLTGYLHDIDFEEFPHKHPGESLKWFKEWGFLDSIIHAVEAHAHGYNGFTTEPATKMAAALIACDELCGIFYAYSKVNPIKYGDMKASSILKRLRETAFAPKIDRSTIQYGVDKLGLPLENHVGNLVSIFKVACI